MWKNVQYPVPGFKLKTLTTRNHKTRAPALSIWDFPFILFTSLRFFIKNGPIPDSFCLFSFFSHHNFNKTNWKKRRWHAWDSNLLPKDGMYRRYHWAMVGPLHSVLCIIPRLSKLALLRIIQASCVEGCCEKFYFCTAPFCRTHMNQAHIMWIGLQCYWKICNPIVKPFVCWKTLT